MDDDDEIPTPHEHAVEEAAERDRDGLAQKVALMTAWRTARPPRACRRSAREPAAGACGKYEVRFAPDLYRIRCTFMTKV
jgi:hypothetical protein